jgi:DNA-binding XRE family transcriptional regulator
MVIDISLCENTIVMTEIHVGDAIRKLREERGWNRADLARIADIRPNTIGDLEKLGTPTMKTIGAVAHAFGLRVEDIFYKLRELRHGQPENPVVYADPAHVRYHDLLERILKDHEPRCINTVIAVLETIAGGDDRATSGGHGEPNDLPEPSIGVPGRRSRSKSGWRG